MADIAFLKQIAKEAGQFLVGSGVDRQSHTKLNAKDLVTVSDIKAQDLIRTRLLDRYPDAVVLSEEDSPEARRPMFAADFTGYILDPIDGTYNFKRDMRESAISIGYIENGQPHAGVVYDPFKDELFEATVGQGAFCNSLPIHVSDQTAMAGASIGTSNSYDDQAMDRNLRRQLAIYEQTGIMPWMHCHGSGVLVMTNIACGRFDAYHHNALKPWDNAAAFLIVREAGGVVEKLAGTEASYTDSMIVCGTPAIVAQLQSVFAAIDPVLLT
jgi:myo-inositol-1(or 4)-monophosphatase